jgi:ethanolamine utilization microcompartment shell protein EutL
MVKVVAWERGSGDGDAAASIVAASIVAASIVAGDGWAENSDVELAANLGPTSQTSSAKAFCLTMRQKYGSER